MIERIAAAAQASNNQAMQEPDEIRPLPEPPYCRGIQVDDETYTGCAYGYGDLAPFTGPCDCPTCKGSGLESPIGTTLPHGSFGGRDCCGCLNAEINRKITNIVCNECGAIVKTVPTVELEHTLDEMELALDVASELCPHCGAANLFPGFSQVLAYICRECGRSTKIEPIE